MAVPFAIRLIDSRPTPQATQNVCTFVHRSVNASFAANRAMCGSGTAPMRPIGEVVGLRCRQHCTSGWMQRGWVVGQALSVWRLRASVQPRTAKMTKVMT
jgi:hypothetical protein